MSAADQKTPMVLSNDELKAEADQLAHRIAHSNLPMRDVRLVLELAARLPAHQQTVFQPTH